MSSVYKSYNSKCSHPLLQTAHGDVEGSHVCEEHHGYKESTRTQNTCKKINIIVEKNSM